MQLPCSPAGQLHEPVVLWTGAGLQVMTGSGIGVGGGACAYWKGQSPPAWRQSVQAASAGRPGGVAVSIVPRLAQSRGQKCGAPGAVAERSLQFGVAAGQLVSAVTWIGICRASQKPFGTAGGQAVSPAARTALVAQSTVWNSVSQRMPVTVRTGSATAPTSPTRSSPVEGMPMQTGSAVSSRPWAPRAMFVFFRITCRPVRPPP